MAGVDQHSDYKVDPWGRLQRTVEYVVTTTFGDTAAAEAMGARVRAVHERVVGVDPHTGQAYRAGDPDLLAWVHNVEVHSFVAAYRRYGGWLSDGDADRFVAEMTRVAPLVGLPSDAVPSTLDDLRAVLREAPLEITPAAKAGARTILSPPLPLALRPLYGVAVAGAVSLLPRKVRAAYGVPWFPPAEPRRPPRPLRPPPRPQRGPPRPPPPPPSQGPPGLLNAIVLACRTWWFPPRPAGENGRCHTPLVPFAPMTRADLDARLRSLALEQHGALSRRQAEALGVDRWAVERRLRSGAWRPGSPRVLVLEGTAATFEQRCVVAVLDAGHEAVVRGAAAAHIWALPGFGDADIEVTRLRRRARRRTDPVPAHEPLVVPPHHRTVHRGVPVTTVERTVFDLMAAVREGRAERALDNALARKLTSLRALRSIGEELCRRGRPGSALYRRLLSDRGVDFRPTESGLEADFLALLVEAGLPEPERQVDLGGEGWIGRVDFYVREARLVVEIDSDWFHTSALDAAADARRDEAFRAAGFEVVRITEGEIRSHPVVAVERLRRALANRRAA